LHIHRSTLITGDWGGRVRTSAYNSRAPPAEAYGNSPLQIRL
jgi:hypothetical protein